MPHDTITITKLGKKVIITFTVHKLKKFSFNRRKTTIIFDFGTKHKDSLQGYAMWLIDDQTGKACLLNKKFDLSEKKRILTGMVTHKNKRIKQKEGDLFKNGHKIDTKQDGSKLTIKYRGKVDASVNSLRLREDPFAEKESTDLLQYERFLKDHVIIESKNMIKDAEFNVSLERVNKDSMVDLKVRIYITQSIFEVMSCISFKGTQYKEFRFLREMFRSIDQEYYPKSIKIPINYSFSINFEVDIRGRNLQIENNVPNIDK